MSKKSNQKITNEERYNEFRSHLKLEHGLSDSTCDRYINVLQKFKLWTETNTKTLPVPWSEISESEIRRYITHVQPKPAYANLIISTLRRFFLFLRDIQRERTDDPTARISRPKQSQHHAASLEPFEIDKLMTYAYEHSKDAVKLRNWSLIGLLYGSGLRISEACTLQMSNIRYQDELPVALNVIGKGNKERTVYLSATAQTALYKWLKERQKILLDLPPTADNASVWIVPVGRYAGQQLKPPAVRKMLTTFSQNAIGKHVHPHMFRHTFVTEAVRARAPLHAIQAAAGHADLSTTGRYMHANDDDIKQVAEAVPDVLEK